MEDTNQLRVRLVTPERIVFEHTVETVELPAKNGYLEVLPGHAPLVAELGAGDVTLHGAPVGEGVGDVVYHVSWGFVEVLPERVTILASNAIKPAEIDVPQAERQLDRGLELWKKAGDSPEAYEDALRVIAEAEANLASAAEKR
jgi:F-type H+-transporting ATPase subunit epsilon